MLPPLFLLVVYNGAVMIPTTQRSMNMTFIVQHLARVIGFPFRCFLGAIDKILPAGHQTITPGEISPNSGPIDVEM